MTLENSIKEEIARPMVSIVCITYNHEKFLAKALDSFLMQKTSFTFEIVVGEDCSQDGTASILAEYSTKFPEKIRAIFNKTNLGMITNAVHTTSLCRGHYIATCEGDDYWMDPLKIQKQVEFLEANPDYILCFHDALIMKNEIIETNPKPFSYIRHDLSKEDLLCGAQLPTLTVCYRNVIQKIPSDFYNAPILDLCTWSMLGAHGKGKFMPDIIPAVYRVHAGGAISMKAQSEKYRMTMHTLSLLSEYWKKKDHQEISKSLKNRSILMGFMSLDYFEMLIFFVKLPIYFSIKIAQSFKQKMQK